MEIQSHVLAVKTIRSLTIAYDECPVNPRTDYEPMCKIATVAGTSKDHLGDIRMSIEELNDIRKSEECISMPVYIMDHSGVSLSLTSFNDKWDSGVFGLIYISKNRASHEFEDLSGLDLERKIWEVMEGEISLYNMYLIGSCYYAVIKTQKETEIDGEKYYTKTENEDSLSSIFAEYGDILPEVLSCFGMAEEDFESITVLDRKVK